MDIVLLFLRDFSMNHMNKSLKKETRMSPLPTIDEENLFNQKVWSPII